MILLCMHALFAGLVISLAIIAVKDQITKRCRKAGYELPVVAAFDWKHALLISVSLGLLQWMFALSGQGLRPALLTIFGLAVAYSAHKTVPFIPLLKSCMFVGLAGLFGGLLFTRVANTSDVVAHLIIALLMVTGIVLSLTLPDGMATDSESEGGNLGYNLLVPMSEWSDLK